MEAIYAELQELLKVIVVSKPKLKKKLTEHFGFKPIKIYKMAKGVERPHADLARLIVAYIKKHKAP